MTGKELNIRDRRRGALIGLAVGDAVGAAVEFAPPGSFAPLSDMVGGGPWGLKPGQWTDDTSMALCLAESLIERGEFEPGDQMRRYLRWREGGYLSSKGYCFDIGPTTSAALTRFQSSGNPYSGSTDRYKAGNGSLMRLAPVPVFFADDPERALDLCAASSRTTHATLAAVDACRYFGALLLGALHGATKEELVSPFYTPIPGYWERAPLVPEIAAIAAGSFRRKRPPEIRGRVYVVDTLEAALWAFHTTADFRAGCLAAANLGDDADTTAAIFGQIGGAFYGESGIPTEWRARLAMWEVIDRYAEGLAGGAAGPRGQSPT